MMINLKKKELKKMKKSKTKKLILAITVGVLLLGFLPVAAASGNVTKRPIEHWAVNNWGIGGWGTITPTEYLEAYPDWWMYGLEEYEYSGHIIEKRLKDGSFLITVNLNVKDIGVVIFKEIVPPDPEEDPYMELVLQGYANFKYQFVCHLYADIPGNDFVPYWGDWIWIEPGTRSSGFEIPWWIQMFFFGDIIGAQVISQHGVLAGKGECTGAGGYEAGPATFIINQRGLFFGREHPQTNPVDPFWGFWPVESIEIHQN